MASRKKQEDAQISQNRNIEAFIDACVEAKGGAASREGADIRERLEIEIAKLTSKPTIENINNFIVFMKKQGLYENDPHDKTVRSGNGVVDEVFGGHFLRMQASGNNHDCLIHSFLTCVSTEFRTLSVPSRNEFANLFRRGIFPGMPMPEEIDNRLRKHDVSVDWFRGYKDTLLQPGSDLTERHATLLCAQFGINILFFFTRRGHMVMYTPRELCNTLGIESCTGKNHDTIMMKMDGVHFEPIVEQRPSGGGAPPHPTYIIDEGRARVLFNNNDRLRKVKACPVCGTLNYPETTTCSVCDRKFPHAKDSVKPANKACAACTLRNPMDAAACRLCNTKFPPAEDSVKPGKACSACTLRNPMDAAACRLCGKNFTTRGGGRTRRIKKKSKITRRKKYNLSWRKKYNLI